MVSKRTRGMTLPTHPQSNPSARPGCIRPYNAPVATSDRPFLVCLLLALTVVLFYPGLFLGQVLAPQAALWSVPPWSEVGGPNPSRHEPTNRVAFSLAPRLALIQREGLDVALWNPYLGGGRVGWMAMAAEGYPPLAVLAALVAREPYHFTALGLITALLAFSGAFRLARRFLPAQPSALGALVYTLSGPVVSGVFAVSGTVAALVPWLMAFAYQLPRWSGVVGTALVSAALAVSGGHGLPWLVVPLVRAVSQPKPKTLGAAALAFGAGLALAFPSLFLAYFGGETPGLWWLDARPVPPAVPLDLVVPGVELARGERPFLFVGLPTVLLAAVGLARRWPGFPVAVTLLAVGACAAFLPVEVLPGPASSFRPTLALALALALLAGAGAQWILGRTPQAWRPLVAGALGFVLLVRLLPGASSWFPWQGRERAQLPAPGPGVPGHLEDLVFPLVTLFPPDAAAVAGLADVRHSTLAGEPQLRKTLAPGSGGVLHFSRVSDRFLAQMGVRWALEPLELKLVSGELFARLSLAESPARDGKFPVTVPTHATRLGLRISSPPPLLQLHQGTKTWVLDPDRALAEEAEGWWWWKVPTEVTPGPASLLPDLETSRHASRLDLAWDTSGWELAEETDFLRVWEQRWFLPLVSWARVGDDGSVPPTVIAKSAQKLVVETQSGAGGTLVVRWKFRPRLQRVLLDGKPASWHPGPFPWSAVEVPSGARRVTLKVALPAVSWLAPLFGAVALIGLRRVLA